MISEFIFISLLGLIVGIGAYNSIRHFQRTWVENGGNPRTGWHRGILSIVGGLAGTFIFLVTLGGAYRAFGWAGILIVSGLAIASFVAVHSALFTPPGRKAHAPDEAAPPPNARTSERPSESERPEGEPPTHP